MAARDELSETRATDADERAGTPLDKATPDTPSPGSTGETTRHPTQLLRRARVSFSIAILFVNYFLAQYDKFILSYFQGAVIASLGLSAPQYALLSGYSTGIACALLALPVAFVADYSAARVWTLSAAAAWWSLCVVCQGLARSFGQVYCARLGMGVGQAAVEALSVSLISDLVGWRDVFVGESVFFVGVYIGEAVSGQIATAFTSTGTSWQVAMRAVGIAGIVVALVLRASLREPPRRTSLVQQREGVVPDAREHALPGAVPMSGGTGSRFGRAKHDLTATLDYIVRMRSFWLLILSAAMRQLAGNVFGYYMPGYQALLYPSRSDLLSNYGIIVGTVGSATVLSGGALTSLLWHKTKLTPIYLTSIGGMVSSLFVLLMIFSRDIADGDEGGGVRILYGAMSAAYLTAETWLGCFFALIALLLPPAYKTFGLAIWSSVQVLIYSSGPEIIGLALRGVDPESQGYTEGTQTALAVIIPVGYWACGVGLLAAIPLLRRDLNHDFVQGPLSPARRMGFWTFAILLFHLVVVLFTLSLVYDT